MKKIMFIAGARPNFIKLAPFFKLTKQFNNFEFKLVHTGQHYDNNMSEVFFEELNLPKPDFYLGIGGGSHGEQTGKMIIELEKLFISEKPDLVIVIGDVNSTLAGVIAASKLNIKTAHIEAGLRSFNRSMPEEINRIIADSISDILFAPSFIAIENLKKEGLEVNTYFTGDVMYDALLDNLEIAKSKSNILSKLNLESKNYILVTLHRPYNVDDLNVLKNILSAFSEIEEQVVFPVHPRTKSIIEANNFSIASNIIVTEPLGYLDFLTLESSALRIITDSGGVQKEAYFLGIPCLTLRPETEWIETVKEGMNVLVEDRSKESLLSHLKDKIHISPNRNAYGKGDAALQILNVISRLIK